MSVFDKEQGLLYIEAYELVQFVFRGGSLDPQQSVGSKNGGSIVSHKLWENAPTNITECMLVDLDGIDTLIYTSTKINHEGGKITKYEVVDYSLDYIDGGYLEILQKEFAIIGYIICEKYDYNALNFELIVNRSQSEDERTFSYSATKDELKEQFDLATALFAPFAGIIKQRAVDVKEQLASLHFPFEGGAREGQKDFIIDVARAIKSQKRLIVQAPTGTGKTMASLYPALKAMAKGDADKIFYFTGKTTTAIAALNASEILKEQLPDLRVIHISAKDKCCVTYGTRAIKRCDARHCIVARDYFNKINVAILDLLENYRTYTKDVIDEISARYGVCSYELSLELSEWCDIIICDYNYLFDPQAYLRRYFELPPEAKFVFLIDEAHNLNDRAREMYSCTLYKAMFEGISNRFPQVNGYSEACEALVDLLMS